METLASSTHRKSAYSHSGRVHAHAAALRGVYRQACAAKGRMGSPTPA